LLLAALTLLAYQRVWQSGFIWDDNLYVTLNTTLRDLAGLWRIWFEPTARHKYYPLVHTSFWLEYQLWQLNPLGFHLVNVVLHISAAVLLWRVLVLLRVPGAWIAAAIFALHPVEVESVAWVSERRTSSRASSISRQRWLISSLPPRVARRRRESGGHFSMRRRWCCSSARCSARR
jgi:hypothetical protein